jgi:hypothetical protein
MSKQLFSRGEGLWTAAERLFFPESAGGRSLLSEDGVLFAGEVMHILRSPIKAGPDHDAPR